MIIIFEYDSRLDENHKFFFFPEIFKGFYEKRKTFRFCLWFFSISYFPEKGIKEFTDCIASGKTEWKFKSQY